MHWSLEKKTALNDTNLHFQKTSVIGHTALHDACLFGSTGVVKLLLAHNANKHTTRYGSKETPLHAAASEGHANIVEMMLGACDDDEEVIRVSGLFERVALCLCIMFMVYYLCFWLGSTVPDLMN